MLHVSSYSTTESLFGAFHEVVSATTVYVDVDTARNNIHTLCINHICAYYCEVAIGYC